MASLIDGVSSAVQNSVISANLNSAMLFNFLMGVYTLTYVGTVYLYVSRKSASTSMSYRVVLTAISTLYAMCLGVFIIEWYYLDLAIVMNGETQESDFNSMLSGGSLWVFIAHQILFFGVFIVSDGLLIWRCYHVWGRNLRIIAILLMLFIGQIGLFFAVIVLAGLVTSVNSPVKAAVVNNIQSAQALLSFGTTIVVASLIGYRIHSTTKYSMSKDLFKHVSNIVVESAATYAVVMLVYAVYAIRISAVGIGSILWNSSYYVESMATFIGGMAPTVMAARIVFSAQETEHEARVNQHMLSIIKFRTHGVIKNKEPEGNEEDEPLAHVYQTKAVNKDIA